MRIIAGANRGKRLHGPDPDDLRIRPTSDRAREALFAILQKWPSGPFLDLFGGTGAVALEAHSRGYAPVHCVEKSPAALKLIAANAQGTGVDVVRRDVLKLPGDAYRDMAVVFADPPYPESAALWTRMAPVLQAWVKAEGVLVWETDARTDLDPVTGWDPVDVRSYGAARFHLFVPVQR